MEFVNCTPFDAIAFEGVTADRRAFHVIALKQTYAFDARGVLAMCDEQAPLLAVDTFHGEMNQSSVACESDFCHYKPKCDVLLVGSAHAPGAQAVPRFTVHLQICRPDSPPGETLLDKTLAITGSRTFDEGRDGWRLSDAEPALQVPLTYEYAYGGENRLLDPETQEPVIWELDERNPVGRGYAHPDWLKHVEVKRVPAPQIESPTEPVTEFGRAYEPCGFGVLSKAWLPRRTLLGTVDQAFIESNAPLPADFKSAYWNAAPADQQIAYLTGDEVVDLTNLTPEGHTRLQLPGHIVYGLLRYEDGDIAAPSLKLDTLLIDTTQRRVHLTWRLVVMKHTQRPLRIIETRFRSKERDDALRADIAQRLTTYLEAELVRPAAPHEAAHG